MKIATANQQGQVVIPVNLRRKFKITEKTFLKIFSQDDCICIKPFEEENVGNKKEKIVVNFPKNYQQNEFHFHTKNSKEKNLAEKVDEILY